MNTFINLVKRFLVGERTKGGVGASRKIKALVKALLLPTLDFLARLWAPTSSCYFSTRLAKGLTQKLRQIPDLGAIVKV